MYWGLFIYLTFVLLVGPPGFIQAQTINPDHNNNFKKNPQVREADSLIMVWEWEKAWPKFERLAIKFKEQGDWEGYIYSLNKKARAELGQSEYPVAYNTLNRTLEEGTALLAADHPEVGRTHCYLGIYWLWGKGKTGKADSSFIRSLEIWENTLPPDHLDLAEIHHELGRYYREVEQFEQSKYHHEKAIEIYRSQLGELSLPLARAYRYYGLTLRDAHYPTRAMNVRLASKRMYEAIPYSPVKEISFINDNLGVAYFDLDDFEQARGFFEKSLEMKAVLFGKDSPQWINQLNNLASCYGYLNDLNTAIHMFEEAIARGTKLGSPENDYLINSYEQYADVLFYHHHVEKAIYYGEKALQSFYASENDSQFQKSSIAESLALYYLANHDLDQSMDHIQTAIHAIDTTLTDLNQEMSLENFSTPFPDQVYKCLSTKALILTEIGFTNQQPSALDEALQMYEFLELLSDKFRNALYAERSKLFLAQFYRANAEHALSLIARLHQDQPHDQYPKLAFHLMEKNRYIKLYGDQSRARKASGTNIPDSLMEYESVMSSKMEGLRFKLNGASDSLRRLELQSEIFDLDNEYAAFQQRMSRDFPTYYSETFRSMLSLDDVQEQMDQNTQIIEYFWSDTIIYAIVITDIGSDLHAIPFSLGDREILKSFLEDLARTQPSDSASNSTDRYAKYEQTAHHIYSKLMEPLSGTESKSLIVSPDGILSLLPFEALIVSPGQADFKNAQYLLHTRDVNYTYSLNLLYEDMVNKRQEISSPKILAMAFSDHDMVGEEPKDQSSLALPEIVGSSFECDIIAEIFQSYDVGVYKGVRATEEVFKEQAEKHHILHLAVHGSGDTENELNSSLHFRDAPNANEDGRLLAYELYGMELNDVHLAVLSACESGVGKEIEGEGIFSIARGFAQAGCPATMMSLWNVNDMQTSEITRLFYKNLKKGMQTNLALLEAKKSFIEVAYFSRSAVPFFWAGFVHIGVSSPVTGSNNKWFLWVGLSFLAVSLLGWWLKSTKYA